MRRFDLDGGNYSNSATSDISSDPTGLDDSFIPPIQFQAKLIQATESGSTHNAAQSVSNAEQIATAIAPITSITTPPTHLVIDVTYDSSVTSLQTSNPTLYADYTGAVQQAVSFYENEITTPITLNMSFGWGEVGGQTIDAGAVGESSASFDTFTYGQLYNAVVATDTTSAVQTAAVASLPTTDPTGGAMFQVATAEEKALGLGSPTGSDGAVGLDSTEQYTWTQSATSNNIAANTQDAVGTFEHEISEVMGRSATLGSGGQYSLLDMFHYSAANGLGTDAPGAAAGALDEPFVTGYNPNTDAYFSFDGKTVTLPYDTPAQVGQGDDVGDWTDSVANDSYGFAASGEPGYVSATDLEEMNVLGYAEVACYAAGTRLRTPDGEVAIERLRAGDLVTLASGAAAAVRWIGTRRIAFTRRPGQPADDRTLALPVRVPADAFGPGQPVRDLFLSPEHAVFWQGVLIPVRHLIGCRGIAVDAACAEVTYLHVELDRHDVLLAEGLPCESWLDTGNRAMFANSRVAALTFVERTPASMREGRCAPLVESGPALAAIRRALGGSTVQDVAIEVAGKLAFVVSRGVSAIRLSSQSFVAGGDRRRLGAAVKGLRLDGVAIGLDDHRLSHGFHPSEGGWRWTDGEGLIAVAPSAHPRMLEVEIVTLAEAQAA